MNILQKKNLYSFLIALAFAFNITIFAPIEFYYINVFDFWFTIDYILLTLIIIFIVVFISVFLLIRVTKNKIHEVLIKVFTLLSIALYIQGNYLNFGYDVLNGADINWNSMLIKGIINTIVWLIILVIPFLVKFLRKNENFLVLGQLILIFIILIEIMTLGYCVFMGYASGANSNIIIDSNFYLDDTNLFKLSSQNNIVLFMADTLEGNFVNEVLEKYPEYKEKLKDFVYFDNCTSPSIMTFSSVPTLLTGQQCQVGKNLKQNINYCYENSNLYKTLVDNNYNVELYTELQLVPTYNIGYISNWVEKKVLIDTSSTLKITRLLYDCVFYRYMPHFLKSNFLIDTSEFNKVNSTNVSQYVLNDPGFNSRLLTEGILNSEKKNQFKFYHLDGAHAPYNTTTDIEYNNSSEYLKTESDERQMTEVLASLNILVNYVEELKKGGCYDNTTIIFLADHGWNNRYYPAVLVKKQNNNQEFSVSHAPISVTEDLIPTILNVATSSKNYGKDFFDYNDGEQRTRNVASYTYTRGDNTYNVLSKITVSTESTASDIDSFYIANAEYSNSNVLPEKKYKFGKEINILNSKNLDYAIFEGILQTNIRATSKGTNIGKEANIKLLREESDNDVTASILIKKTYYDNQNVRILLGNTVLYEDTLNTDDKNKLIIFNIPKELWNKEELLNLKLEFPDGKLGNPEVLGEETLFMSVLIEKIYFNN